MKSLKLLAAGLLAFAVAVSASAQTTVRVVGSTAFRAAAYNAILGSLQQPGATAYYIGGSLAGANQAVIIGHLRSNGNPVTILTCFAGSVGGVEIVATGITAKTGVGALDTQAWINPTQPAPTPAPAAASATAAGPIGGQVLTGAAPQAAIAYLAAATGDIAMSDSFQKSTKFIPPFPGAVTLTDGTPGGTPGVGVVDFFWVKGVPCAGNAANFARFTNMTWAAANLLFNNGQAPLSLLTGNCLDDSLQVLLTGRDPDSGTRLAAELEAQFNPGNAVTQYTPQQAATLDSAAAAVSCNPVLSAAGLGFDGGAVVAGNNGFSSGGNLATAIAITQDCCSTDLLQGVNYIYVTYLGRNDAKSKDAAAARWLTYDGSKYIADVDGNFCPITRGQYTFWTYEHCYRKTLAGDALGFWNLMVGNFTADPTSTIADASVSGVTKASMLVSRTADGGLVAP